MSDQPQPVLNTATVAGVIMALATGLGTIGFTSAETKLSGAATALSGIVVAVAVLAGHIVAALHVRQQVTPIANPKDGAGRALAPAAEMLPMASSDLVFYQGSGDVGQTYPTVSAISSTEDEDLVDEPEPSENAPSPPHPGRAVPAPDTQPGRHAALE